MVDHLVGSQLFEHVRALAAVIGPRPPGSRQEAQARQYVRHALADLGIGQAQLEESTFFTPTSPGASVGLSAALGLGAALLPKRVGVLGAGMAFLGAFNVLQLTRMRRQPLLPFVAQAQSANLIARIPASGEVKRRVVLIGHLDTNRHRLTFSPELRPMLRATFSAAIGLSTLAGVSRLFSWNWLRRLTSLSMVASLAYLAADEMGGFVPGANDNASAVALLLGLGGQLMVEPLVNTEVWLAFTGAEETACIGMHALLDKHRETLADAYFLDFEMVGAGDIAYVTHHSGLSHFADYAPDDESLAWAVETARDNPALGVRGVPMTIFEEVGALRARGFRGLCLVGVGSDGWLVNWHRHSDNIEHIDPRALERTARFAWAMLRKLDSKP